MKTKLSNIKITAAFKKTHPIYKDKTYWVKTSRGESAVKVTKTFISNKPPVDTEILDFTFA